MPASNPTAGDVHVNTPLTNFSQKYLLDQSTFVASRAFPNNPVAKQSDLYYEFARGDFFRDEAEERADGTESKGGSFRLSTNPYFARVYAFHKDVTDRQRANQDSQVQLDNSATQYVTHKLLIRREKIFTDTYMSTGVWATDKTTGMDWDGAGDPIAQIREAKRTIQQSTGYRPNKMVIDRAAYDILLDNEAILSRIVGGANNNVPAMVMRTLLAQLFELDEIFVMDSIYNSAPVTVANKDAASNEFMSTNNALLYYAPNSVALNEPTAAVQFSWTGWMGATGAGMRVKRFRMEQLEADRIEGQMAFDYKVTAADLGYFFSDVTAA